MKKWSDEETQNRGFSPSDKVLVLLATPGSTLHACYIVPYIVQEGE